MNQDELNQAVWWVLQRIKEKLREKPDSSRIEYIVHVLENEPAVPAFNIQEAALKELHKIGAISVYEVPQGNLVVIGLTEYAVNILQPKFDQVYQELEKQYVGQQLELPDPSNFSDELKEKIAKIIKIIKHKHELDLATSGQNRIWKLTIPEQDFLSQGVGRDELDKMLIMLGKKLMFTPYLKDKDGITVGFAPAVPAQKAIDIMSQYSNKLEPKLKPIKGENKVSKAFPYKLIAGTKWEHITIQFLDNQNSRITVGKNTIEANFADMGFEDGRTGKPNKQWALLLILARHHGEINTSDPEVNSKIKKTKELLAKQLQSYFPLDYDPFWPYEPYLPYKEKPSYQIKLQLIPADSKPVIVEEEQDEISREVREMFEV